MTHQPSSLAEIYLDPSAGPFQEGILDVAKGVGRGMLGLGKELVITQAANMIAEKIVNGIISALSRKKGPASEKELDQQLDQQIASLPGPTRAVAQQQRAKIRAAVKSQMGRRRESLAGIYREASLDGMGMDQMKKVLNQAMNMREWEDFIKNASPEVREMAAKALEPDAKAKHISETIKAFINRGERWDENWQSVLSPEQMSKLTDDQRRSYQKWFNSDAGEAARAKAKPNKAPKAAIDVDTAPKVKAEEAPKVKRVSIKDQAAAKAPKEPKKVKAAPPPVVSTPVAAKEPTKAPTVGDTGKTAAALKAAEENRATLVKSYQRDAEKILDTRIGTIKMALGQTGAKAPREEYAEVLKSELVVLQNLRNEAATFHSAESAKKFITRVSQTVEEGTKEAKKALSLVGETIQAANDAKNAGYPVGWGPASRGNISAVGAPKKASLADTYLGNIKPLQKGVHGPRAPIPALSAPTPQRPLSGGLLANIKAGAKTAVDEIKTFASRNPGKTIGIGVAVGAVVGLLAAKLIDTFSSHTGMSDGELRHEIDKNLERYLRGMPGEQSVLARAQVDQQFRSHLVSEIFNQSRGKVPYPGQQTKVGQAVGHVKKNAGAFAKDAAGKLGKAAAIYGAATAVHALSGGKIPKTTTAAIIAGKSQISGGRNPGSGAVFEPIPDRTTKAYLRSRFQYSTEAQAARRARKAAEAAARDAEKRVREELKSGTTNMRGSILPFTHPVSIRAVQKYIQHEYDTLPKFEKEAYTQRMKNSGYRAKYERDVYEELRANMPELLQEH